MSSRVILAACLALLVAGTAAAYDQGWAERMVYQAGIAYCPASTIVSDTCGMCGNVPSMSHVTIANDTEHNLQAYVAYSPSENTVYVGYRGTQESSIRNWITNLNFDHTHTSYPHCNCEVHEGFYEAHESIKPQVVAAVTELIEAHGAALVITGHSLGAALAVLSAAHFQTQTPYAVKSLYTFGLPRVGNKAFSQWFNQQLPQAYFVVHYHDIVPHLPPEDFGFNHVPTEVWYSVESGLTYKVCDGSGEDPTCSDSVDVLEFSVNDHMYYLDIHITGCDS